MRRTLLAALMLAASRAGAADFTRDAIGTTGSEFLLMDIGARCIGMGGACTAITNDADSLYWNPAGLTKIPRFAAAFMYSRYVADISYQSAEAASRVGDNGVFGAGARYRDSGSISHTDLAGNTLGTFHPRDYVAEVGWGQKIFDLSDNDTEISMGLTGRWIHSDLLQHADGYGGDLGVISRLFLGSYIYDFGFAAQNLGTGQRFDQVRDTMPSRAKLGAAIYPVQNLTVSLDAIMPANDVAHAALGAEYLLDASQGVKAAFRVGFNSLTLGSLDMASAFSGGTGIRLGDFSFDYAFVPMGVLGSSIHRFSISYGLPAKLSQRYEERY